MELRKNPRYDLERRRPMFFMIGLCLALSFAISAFEFGTYEKIDPISFVDEEKTRNDVFIPYKPEKIKIIPEKKPVEKVPAKKVETNKFEIVDDFEGKAREILEVDVFPEEDDIVVDINAAGEVPEETAPEFTEYAEEMPKFPGGHLGFQKFMARNMKYTRQAIRNGVEGKVYVQFIVEKDGSLSDIKVVKGLGYGLDEQAIKALQQSPPWLPGRQGGFNVRVRMMMPVYFQLK